MIGAPGAQSSGGFSPHGFSPQAPATATELVCFRLDEPLALARVRELRADPEAVRSLALGSLVSWNRLSGARLGGRVF